MSTPRPFFAILLVLACLAGCTPPTTHAPELSDVLLISYSEEPESLNPLVSGDTTGSLFQSFVYEQLADRDLTHPDNELKPRLAEKWEFDESRLEYTIHLRRGVKWHPIKLPSGEMLSEREVTTRDVQFTFDCILNPHIPASRSVFEDPNAKDASNRYIIELEVVDTYTFKIRWKKAYFLADEATLMAVILPRHVFSVDERGDLISLDFSSQEFAEGFNNHWAGRQMCGTGPMMFVDWNRNERLTLERNPNYWGDAFHFERLIFNCEPNSYALLQKLLQGQTDWADIDQKDLYLQNRDNPAVKAEKVVLKTYDYPGYRYVGYNLRRPFLNERDVRRALTHAIPIEQIIKVVFNELATQVTGPFALQSSAYDKRIEPLAYDLDEARKLLKNAGWQDTNRDGIVDKVIDGKLVDARIDLLIEANSAAYQTVAQIIQNNWRQIGVRAQITPVQQALMTQRMRAKDFDAVILGWSLSWRPDPFQTWHSGNAELAGTSNIIGYRNEQVDRLAEKLRVTFDRQEQIKIYRQIHRLIYDDQPYTFLFAEKQTCGYSGRLGEVRFYAPSPCINIREWTQASELSSKDR